MPVAASNPASISASALAMLAAAKTVTSSLSARERRDEATASASGR
jgi:hypothetical protein